MKKVIFTLLFVCALFSTKSLQASTSTSEDSLSFNLNADIVSRYVWRGLLLSPNPNIQPYASIAYKGLTFGAWGSYGVSTNYAESDLYLSYVAGPLTFTINDYYTAIDDSLYFNFKKSETLHALEGAITYTGPESFPVSITAATFFGGSDDYDGDGKNDYSTYLEVAYTANVSGVPVKLFVGGTPKKGLYSDKSGLVNVGLTATKILKVNDDLEIPVFTSIVVNPASKDLFMVFGITF